jgi:hypothetical protein
MSHELYVQSRGIRITVARDLIKVECATEEGIRHGTGPLLIEIDYLGVRQTEGWWDPRGHAFSIIPPRGHALDLSKCDVRVKRPTDGVRVVDGTILKESSFVLCEHTGGQKFITVQCGRMKCVACSDATRLRPGQMWLGKDKFGFDEWCVCPECNGTGEVPRYKHLDPNTGLEIDYEAVNRPLIVA